MNSELSMQPLAARFKDKDDRRTILCGVCNCRGVLGEANDFEGMEYILLPANFDLRSNGRWAASKRHGARSLVARIEEEGIANTKPLLDLHWETKPEPRRRKWKRLEDKRTMLPLSLLPIIVTCPQCQRDSRISHV